MLKLSKAIKKILRRNDLDQYLTKKYLDYSLTIFSLFLGYYLWWSLQDLVFFTFIIWMILSPVSSRFLAKIALCLLFFVPLFLIVRKNSQAEQFAILAYYFLILTIVVWAVELKKDQKSSGRKLL